MREITIELPEFVNDAIIVEYIDTFQLDEQNVRITINFFYKKFHFIVIKGEAYSSQAARSNIRFYVLDFCKIIYGIRGSLADYPKKDISPDNLYGYFPESFRNVWLQYLKRLLCDKVFPNG